MTMHPETIPASWTAADDDFFRVAWDVLPAEFLAGAGVLLASYDDETAGDRTAAPVLPMQAPVDSPSRVTT